MKNVLKTLTNSLLIISLCSVNVFATPKIVDKDTNATKISSKDEKSKNNSLNNPNNESAVDHDETNVDKFKLNKEDINEEFKENNYGSLFFVNKNNEKLKKLIKDAQFTYLPLSITLDQYVKTQEGKLHIIYRNGRFVNASIEEVKEYADPNFILNNKETDTFQFLKLNQFRNINVKQLNEFFSSLPIKHGKENIYKNQGQAFVNACKKYNIDVLYLVAHTMLETGNGNSQLAQGNYILLNENGQAVRDDNGNVKLADSSTPNDRKVKVYNFFGIGAVDSNPLIGGLTYAYNNGWTTIEKTIEGSAAWISKWYINSNKSAFKDQNTLYSMKWDFSEYWHQYATDVGWSLKIAYNISKLAYMYTDNDLSFEIPLYKPNYLIPDVARGNKKVFYANSRIKVHSSNSNKSELLGYYNGGEKIEIYGETTDNKWFIVKFDGKTGFIPTSYKDKLLVDLLIWKEENGKYILVNQNTGSKQYGWALLNDNYYFMDGNGYMQVGWQNIGEKTYFFNNSGVMLKGWQNVGEKTYFFDDNGAMQTGKQYIGNSWYYLKADGAMQTGWHIIDDVYHYFADNGYMQTGKQYIGNNWYYFNKEGAMQTGWHIIGGVYHYFADNGYMQIGKQYIGNSWYYFNKEGAMQIGWQKINGVYHYFADNGYMQIGKQQIGNNWYYFNKDGAMQTGWQKIDGLWYYFYDNGYMAVNTVIDGFEIDANGVSNKK